MLSYSRRICVRAFLSERQDDWHEGIAAAFLHFGGVPRTVLGDNARGLVVDRDRRARTVTFHPAYVTFSKDWGFSPPIVAIVEPDGTSFHAYAWRSNRVGNRRSGGWEARRLPAGALEDGGGRRKTDAGQASLGEGVQARPTQR